MKFFKRTDRELDRDLQSLRSKPSDEFILRVSGRVLRSHSPVARSSRAKVGLAMGLTALGVIAFAVFGGLGYASSAASKATSVVKVVKVSGNSPATVSVNSLPAPKTTTTTTTTTTTSGSKTITWTGNGTTNGLCSSVSGSGSYQTWTFILNSPYNGSGSTLSATFATAGSRTVSVTSTTSGGSNGSYHLPVTTGKGDRLLSASATNGTKNSVLTVSHCVLNGTTTGGGDSDSDHGSNDDDGSSGGGGGGGGTCGGSGGGDDSSSDSSSDNGSSDSTSSTSSSTKARSSKRVRTAATGGGSSTNDDSSSDDRSDDDDASSDDNSSGGGNGGGAGGDQYGGCIPICHSASVGKYVLMLVSSADLAYHRAHGDIVPAPSTGCPGDDDSSSDDKGRCNSGRGNGSEGDSSQLIKPSTGSKGTSPTKDCDPGNSGGKDRGGD